MIAKTIGAFTVKTDSTDDVHLVLMENTLQLKNKEGLKYIFDLKGSLVDRKTKGKTTSSTTLKDQNFILAAQAAPDFIYLEESTKERLLKIVKKDVDFLAGLGLMDYSLLLGIERLKEDHHQYADSQNCFVSGGAVYHLSIIDFFQQWNFSKKGERFMKTVLLGKDGKTLSSIEPV